MADLIQCLCQIANAFNDKKRKFLIFFREWIYLLLITCYTPS